MEADAVVIAPGSLYTNIIPNLLVKGVTKAIRESKAFKIYVSNLMTEPGQTYNYSLSDHISAINAHAGGPIIDYCIYDTSEIVPEYIRKYRIKIFIFFVISCVLILICNSPMTSISTAIFTGLISAEILYVIACFKHRYH
jgi:uncharacterized cofD-like protein